MTEERKLKERRVEIDLQRFNGPIAAVPALIQSLVDQYGSDAILSAEMMYDYAELHLLYNTPEDDVEYAARKRREANTLRSKNASARKVRDKELKELARLQEKYKK